MAGPVLECPFCGHKRKTEAALARHVLAKHAQRGSLGPARDGVFSCQPIPALRCWCGQVTDEAGLLAHWQSKGGVLNHLLEVKLGNGDNGDAF